MIHLPVNLIFFSTQPLASITSTSNPLPHNSPTKRARFCAIFARAVHISPSSQKLMPIPINNYLPSVCLHLGSIEDDESKMRMLLDTGAAMNSSNLIYHLWVMSQYPKMVGEFIQCGDGTGYDVVQLLAALGLDSSHQPLDHGKMTAVIRYRTPYLVNKRDPSFIYFALGNDVSLRCVLGLPTLLALGGLINLVKGEFICSEIDRTFPLTLDPPGKGLPEGIVFDNNTPTIPQGVSTNVKPNPFLLHYTSAEGNTIHHNAPTYSDNIIVHDNFFEGNVSRDLEYIHH